MAIFRTLYPSGLSVTVAAAQQAAVLLHQPHGGDGAYTFGPAEEPGPVADERADVNMIRFLSACALGEGKSSGGMLELTRMQQKNSGKQHSMESRKLHQ